MLKKSFIWCKISICLNYGRKEYAKWLKMDLICKMKKQETTSSKLL